MINSIVVNFIDFKNRFGSKLEGKIEVDYVFQEMDSFLPYPFHTERTKPWGTGHAVLCASNQIQEPFAVINADDYYGLDAFQKAHAFLIHQCNEKTYAIIGYQLDKTLSDHGSVSRGVCEIDENQSLISIRERTKIFRKDHKVYFEENEQSTEVSGNTSVSMNFWCFHQSVFQLSAQLFQEFITNNINDVKSEFFIPIVADHFIKDGQHQIKVIPTDAQWFGVTYKEDAPGVKNNMTELIEKGMYPIKLWS